MNSIGNLPNLKASGGDRTHEPTVYKTVALPTELLRRVSQYRIADNRRASIHLSHLTRILAEGGGVVNIGYPP
jgi:hypothetical protein